MNNFIKNLLAWVLLCFFCGRALADDTGIITGLVFNSQTDERLPGANIQVLNTFLGTTSDETGEFTIKRLALGEHKVRASFIGFKAQTKIINVTNHVDTINFYLSPTILELDQLIVTASRQPEELAAAATSVNVLHYQEIKRRNVLRLDQALLSVPGISMVGENINIRGGSGYNRLGGHRHLVLIDDVPVLTSDLGEMNWSIIPVTQVDHVEVLKGAASSLYGSGAISGVINIITKNASESKNILFQQNIGVYDNPSVPEWKWSDKVLYYYKTDVGYSNTFGSLGVRMAVSNHRSTGDRENGFHNLWHITNKMQYRINSNSSITTFMNYSFEDRELFLQWKEQNQALNVPPPDRGNRYKLSGFIGYSVYRTLLSPTLSFQTRLSYNQQLVGVPFNISSAFTPAIGLGGELKLNWKPTTEHSISAGLDFKNDQVESKYYGKRSANSLSPFVQNVWKISNLAHINSGIRLDTYTLVGDSMEMQVSPRLGFSYQPVHRCILHASVGRAFRAATVVERFITAGSKDFRALPNPSLKPERSTLLDLGLRYSWVDNIYTEVTGFYNYYQNLIEPTLSSDLTAQFLNYPAARIWGVEVQSKFSFFDGRFLLDGSCTFMDPRQVESNIILPYRPKFIAFVSPVFSLGNLTIGADFRYMSRIDRVQIYPLDERVPTKVWNFRLGYNWNRFLIQFEIKNLLNYNYTISERVLGEIRNVNFSVKTLF